MSGRHYADSGAIVDVLAAPNRVGMVGTWCNKWVPPSEATMLPGAVGCEDCRKIMGGGAVAPRPMDAMIRDAVEESIRFLRPGAMYAVSIDEHEIVIVRVDTIATATEFLTACRTCARLVSEAAPLRRVFIAIHKHTEEPIT